MSVHQLIYTSRATAEFSAQALLEILGKAQVNNQLRKLSGFLVFHSGSFMQLLEGSENEVSAMYARIRCDSRHTDFKMLFEDDVAQRAMPSWFMGYSASGEAIPGIIDQDFHIPIDEARKICELMDADMRKLFLQFFGE